MRPDPHKPNNLINESSDMISTRTKAITDLSNMYLPSFNDTPALTLRKMARLAQRIQAFNYVYMICFVVLFITRAYIFSRWVENKENWLEIVDVFLMIGTVVNFCLLTAQFCFKKCFLLFAVIYGIACGVINGLLFSKYVFGEEKLNISNDSHLTFIRYALFAQTCCSVLSVFFLIYVLCNYIMIEREGKYKDRANYDRDYMAANFSIALADRSM